MKTVRNILLISFVLRCVITVNAQLEWFGPLAKLDDAKLMVTYRLTYHEDTTDFQRFGRERMILIIGNRISNFQSLKSYELDCICREQQEAGTLLDWLQSGSGRDYASRFGYSMYKNYPEGRITTLDNILFGDNFVYDEDLNGFGWTILDDTVSIAQYPCQKAVCRFGGRTWEAWFTNDLPFSDGPYKFCGLPGLILNIADTQGHYKFEFVSIEAMPKDAIIGWEEQDDRIRTTKEGFFKASKAAASHTDYSDRMDDEMSKKLQGVVRSRNNPIELE